MNGQPNDGKSPFAPFAYVEAILYDYPFLKARLKEIPIPHAGVLIAGRVNDVTSPQECFVCREAETMRLVSAVDRALRAMQPIERRLVRLKYFERWPNYEVAKRLHISESTFYEWRREIVRNVGLALGVESIEQQQIPDSESENNRRIAGE